MTGQKFLARPDLLGNAALLVEEAAFGADLSDTTGAGWTWTDLTADMRHAEVATTTIGRQDNVSQSPTARHGFALNNGTGDYTPTNPTGRNYPNVKQNTPIRRRMSLDGGATWKIRFQGYADAWQPRALDASLKVRKVDVTAFGMLGRLDGRKRPIKAPLARSIAALNPVVSWPLDDGSSATAAAPGLPGGPTLRQSGTVRFGVDGPPGGGTAVDFSGGGTLSASLQGGSSTAWRMGFAVQIIGSPSGGQWEFINWTTTTGARWVVLLINGFGLSIQRNNPDGITADSVSVGFDINDQAWHWVDVVGVQSGSDTNLAVSMDGGAWVSFTGGSGFPSSTLGAVRSVTVNKRTIPLDQSNFAMSSLTISTPASLTPSLTNPNLYQATIAYTGETVSDRLTRFCAQEGIALDLVGTSTVRMGPQPIATTIAVLRDCEATDHGLMYDGLGPGIGYICRSAMHNATIALQIDAGVNNQLTPPFEPYFDRQAITNLWQVSREGGQTVTAEQTTGPVGTGPAGIGIADAAAKVNVDTDNALPAHAGWLLGLTTNEGLRYPAVPMNMRQVPQFAPSVLALRPGSRIQIVGVRNESTDLPPETIDVLLQGWTESTTADTWSIVGNHGPFDPFRIGKVNTMRVQAAATTVAVGFNATATSFTVTGPQWTTTPGMFPFSIMVGGELMTLSNVVGNTFTISARSTNRIVKAHVAGEPVTVFKPGRVGI